MNEHAFAARLASLLNNEADLDEVFDLPGIGRVVPYDEAGVLTKNAGCIVRLDDGSEFQVTVVRSRCGR